MSLAPIPLPSQEELQQMFAYDPITGSICWRIKKSNVIKIGAEAGKLEINGYRRICLNGHYIAAHRIAWKIIHNTEPAEIDHKDNNRNNNAIDNLRVATRSQNCQNCLVYKTHKRLTPYKGVSKDKKNPKWKAYIYHDKKRHHLGYFVTPELAHAAYLEAANKLFGEYANAGYR